jgi:hypothetical protein
MKPLCISGMFGGGGIAATTASQASTFSFAQKPGTTCIKSLI